LNSQPPALSGPANRTFRLSGKLFPRSAAGRPPVPRETTARTQGPRAVDPAGLFLGPHA